MNRDISDVNFGIDIFTASANRLSSTPFVKDVIGEVEVDAGAVLLSDGAHEDTVAVEELQIDGVRVGVVGIVEEQRVQAWSASLVLPVDGGVDVVDLVYVSDVPFDAGLTTYGVGI